MSAERRPQRMNPWRSALTLAGFALLCSALVATTYRATRAPIAENERLALLERFEPVLGDLAYDKIAVEQPIVLDAGEMLPGDGRGTAYAVYRDGLPVAFAFTVSTVGYAGTIELLIGVRRDASVSGVRVLRHSETPGLGDRIEIERSDWIETFRGRSLSSPPVGQWKIRRDGGAFDQLTGASVTPRAIVLAVRQTLQYFSANAAALEAAALANEADDEADDNG